jgi:DNA-binding HxlR family transcriptional regulator
MVHVTDTAVLRYRPKDCSIARSMELLGERWTIMILRAAFNGVRRFDDIQEETGAPRQVLSRRLGELIDSGVLRKVPYQEPGQRQRFEYRLTRKGMDLYPVLLALLEWGDKYLADESGPSLTLTHRDCGEPVYMAMVCAGGHELDSARDVRPIPAPRVSAQHD